MRIPDKILSWSAAESGRHLVLEALIGLRPASDPDPENLFEAVSDLKVMLDVHDTVLEASFKKKESRLVKHASMAAAEFQELKAAFELGLSLGSRRGFPEMPLALRQEMRRRMRGLRIELEETHRPALLALLPELEERFAPQADPARTDPADDDWRGGEWLADWLQTTAADLEAGFQKARPRYPRQWQRLQAMKRLLRPWAGHLSSVHMLLDGLKEVESRLARRTQMRLLRDLGRDILHPEVDEALAQAEFEGGPATCPRDFAKLTSEIASSFRRAAMTEREQERLFLLNSIPRLGREPTIAEVYQGWLPGARVDETISRIYDGGLPRHARRVGLGQGAKRVEIEEETTEEIFEQLWALTEGCRVRKRRYSLLDDDRRVEIEEFHDRDLVLARLIGADQAVSEEPPSWLLPAIEREVTEDQHFRGRRLGI